MGFLYTVGCSAKVDPPWAGPIVLTLRARGPEPSDFLGDTCRWTSDRIGLLAQVSNLAHQPPTWGPFSLEGFWELDAGSLPHPQAGRWSALFPDQSKYEWLGHDGVGKRCCPPVLSVAPSSSQVSYSCGCCVPGPPTGGS